MGPTAYPLLSVSDLAAALPAGPPPVLLDVRWRLGGPPGIDSYRAGHLPGAVYVDLDTQLAGSPGAGGRHPLPAGPDFEAAMRAAGVGAGTPVVVYDDGDGTIAARAWWLLRYYGHRQVQVLDGGFRAWTEAGQPVTTADPTPAAGDFTAAAGQMALLDAAGAAELARTGLLLDARAPARYRGETEPVDRVAGHIPGAVSAPTAENVTSAGLFRPVAELQARFAAMGVQDGAAEHGAAEHGGAEHGAAEHGAAEDAADELGGAEPGPAGAPAPPVGVYCGSGVTAAHEVLALELAGTPAALYVGSWSGWVADVDRPVATGPQPG
jgi:thiosulfate/3-mercaptopyruvate sulfurtransferase